MTDLAELKLFATHEHPCSYLSGRDATTIFVDPKAKLNGNIFSQLSDFGFRRSGAHVYRPRCRQCQACIPVRTPVDLFRPNKTQKRCLNKNKDIQTKLVDSIDTDEHYALYEKYIRLRHSDGDMFPPSREQYLSFLTHEWNITRYIEFRVGEELLAVSVCDQLDRGLSAIYAFFDPTESKRSLGVYNILHLIQLTKELELSFVYLGYWIKDCQKMSYKVDYRPFQLLIEEGWITVNDYHSKSLL